MSGDNERDTTQSEAENTQAGTTESTSELTDDQLASISGGDLVIGGDIPGKGTEGTGTTSQTLLGG